VQLHAFLISTLDGSEWSASSTDSFTHIEGASVTRWILGWLDYRYGLEAIEKRKISTLARNPTPIP
jgi:hypothetical protein